MAVKFAAYETMRTMHRRLTGLKQEDSAAAADISMGLIAGAGSWSPHHWTWLRHV